MSLNWVASQIQSLRVAPPDLIRFNPRPAGVIRPGSTTHVVLQILNDHPRRWFTCKELIERSQQTHSAVSWSLIYLRRLGLIDTAEDSRQENWLRYRAKQSKE